VFSEGLASSPLEKDSRELELTNDLWLAYRDMDWEHGPSGVYNCQDSRLVEGRDSLQFR
jgi:hypothetical protein